jgi:thymidylate synthase (FAD)
MRNRQTEKELTVHREVTILKSDPTIALIASMALEPKGIKAIIDWVQDHRPECLPDDMDVDHPTAWQLLFPHGRYEGDRKLVDNELLVELAGRKCYDSFGLKAGKKTNREYIENTQSGSIPHASINYHAKMTFFFAGISRRVSHEIIRNYVGADRDEEGSPSQESTRFTHHYGFFICPPRYLGDPARETFFQKSMQRAYGDYLDAVSNDVAQFERDNGKLPTSIDRKRIYEAASSFLPHQAETSMLWTTNPMAIAKFIKERADSAADLEIQRFAKKWRTVVMAECPNLFPQSWMKET